MMIVALVSDVFHDESGRARLDARLAEARARGAQLAVLPELPLNPWSPATRNVREDDAEAPGGPRHTILSQAAARAGIALIGGAIVRDPETGARRNTALVFDAAGTLVARYAKVHLPEEEGFWETSHYVPGDAAAGVIDAFGMPLGLQLCSDINRPIGSFTLAARGAEAIVNPRATEEGTWERWKLVLRATALTASAYVLSVNRPGPDRLRPDSALRAPSRPRRSASREGGQGYGESAEASAAADFGIPLGGPSIVVGPDGKVVAESTDPIVTATLDRDVVAAARRNYPGYLQYYPELYVAALRRG